MQYAMINIATGKNPIFSAPEPKDKIMEVLSKAQTEVQNYIINVGKNSDKA